MPPCLSAHPTAFFYGYVDYARNCATGGFENAVVLFHNCDRFIHDPALSDRPGAFHPVDTFAIVAPDTAVNPFDPTPVLPPSGPLVAEAVRNVSNPFGVPFCTTEEPISGGDLTHIIAGCACPLSFGSIQQSANRLKGTGSCPDAAGAVSEFNTLNFFPTVPWFEMITTSIGCWTTAGSYPGPECAYVNEGVFRYRDSCSAIGPLGGSGEFTDIFYGATTRGGFTVVPTSPIFVPTQNFVDLASNLAQPAGVPVALPIIGSVRKTDHLIYVNVP